MSICGRGRPLQPNQGTCGKCELSLITLYSQNPQQVQKEIEKFHLLYFTQQAADNHL